MGRPKKEKPNHATGMYEVKVTVGHTFDGKPVRKSFYSSVSKAAAKAKAEEYKINQAVAEHTGETFVGKEECFDTWAKKVLDNIGVVEAVGSSPVTQTISNPRIYAVCKKL